MEALDQYLQGLAGQGAPMWLTLLIAALLGLRHATDPDHLAAISTLVAHKRADTKEAILVGRAWGIGHGLSMLLFGMPVVLFSSALPESVYQMAEAAVGVIIIYFAIKLAGQVLSGSFHIHGHRHSHDHDEVFDGAGTRRRSFGVGMVHGLGGSYAAALLVVASFHSPAEAVIGLLLFSALAVASMMVVTGAFAFMLSHHRLMHHVPWVLAPLAVVSFLFGLTYLHAAVS